MLSSSLFTAAAAALLFTAGEAKIFLNPTYIRYSTVSGFFLQDDNSTDPTTFDYTKSNLGLINRSYDSDAVYDPKGTKTQWQRFETQVTQLNLNSTANVQYKVLYLARHGDGYHNAAETFYGTPAWNCYWSILEGNSTATWADAHLTPDGIKQAQIANAFWKNAIATQKIPTAESYYSSPLVRCLETANITFAGLDLPPRFPFAPTVKENLRESISIHTCDRRSNRSSIQAAFPAYKFEQGFSEYDLLWRGSTGESATAQTARAKSVLDDIFSSDDATFISISSHSGQVTNALAVLGHRPFRLVTGAVIPVLVKAEVVVGSPATTTISTWDALNTCTASASGLTSVASLGSSACVCGTAATTTAARVSATSTFVSASATATATSK